MKRSMIRRILVGVALAAALMPSVAFASGGTLTTGAAADKTDHDSTVEASEADMLATCAKALSEVCCAAREEVHAQAELTEKVLKYDSADIEAIGTQESSGHTICCPSFSCAYADAVLDGTVNDHSYYTCSNCMWTDWGGGESAYRYVGTDEELLREAYDEIAAGRPTVVHVSASYGEHWIALIGYTGVDDPDSLTLENFIALDPWDGAQIIAADRFALYGDGCQHISDRS